MKIKALTPFYDRAAGMIKREAGEVFEADADRAEELVRRGLAEEAKEKEKEKAKEKEKEPEKEEPKKEASKTPAKKTRKKAAPEE